MKIVLAFALFLFVSTLPAAAGNQCHYVSNGRLYCDPGCRSYSYRDADGHQRFKYTCAPYVPIVEEIALLLNLRPEVVMFGVGVIALLVLLALLAPAINAAAMRQELAEAERQTEKALDIKRRLDAVSDEADRFIQQHLDDSYRRGRSTPKDDRS